MHVYCELEGQINGTVNDFMLKVRRYFRFFVFLILTMCDIFNSVTPYFKMINFSILILTFVADWCDRVAGKQFETKSTGMCT